MSECISKIITWFNANSAAVQAATTIILVILTASYVLLNRSIAKANKKIAQYMKEEFDLMNRPYIGLADQKGAPAIADEYKFEFVLQNYGNTPGLVTSVTCMEYGDSDNCKSIDFKKNTTVFPGQKISIISSASKSYCNGRLGMKIYYAAHGKTFEAEFILQFSFQQCRFEGITKSTTT